MKMHASSLSNRYTAQHSPSFRQKPVAGAVRFGADDSVELTRLASNSAAGRIDKGKTPEGKLSPQQQAEKWERERHQGWARLAQDYAGRTDQHGKTLADYNRELDITADAQERSQMIHRRAELLASFSKERNSPPKKPFTLKRLLRFCFG